MGEPPIAGARCVAAAGEVRAAWDRLAAAIAPVAGEGDCVLLGVLLGGIVPLVEIATRLHADVVLDYCHLTRYQGDLTGGALHWIQAPRESLRDRTIVLIDDVFDQGYTLAELRRFCLGRGARRVFTAVLVHKRHARDRVAFQPDFVGIETGDEYLFGCGMDYRGRWRHLDALYALTPGEG
jgi:hypoxanthine phosphoribosyltransferase